MVFWMLFLLSTAVAAAEHREEEEGQTVAAASSTGAVREECHGHRRLPVLSIAATAVACGIAGSKTSGATSITALIHDGVSLLKDIFWHIFSHPKHHSPVGEDDDTHQQNHTRIRTRKLRATLRNGMEMYF